MSSELISWMLKEDLSLRRKKKFPTRVLVHQSIFRAQHMPLQLHSLETFFFPLKIIDCNGVSTQTLLSLKIVSGILYSFRDSLNKIQAKCPKELGC